MKQLIRLALAASLFTTGIAWSGTAEGFQTDEEGATVRSAVVDVQRAKERVRERVRERLREWYDDQLAALTPEPVTVVEPEPVTPAEPQSPSYGTSSTSWQLSEAEVASYVRGAGFPESVVSTMVAIAQRESNLCPTAVYGYGCAGTGHAVSGGPACGLFQIYPCPGADALDPARNAALAYSKYKSSGLSPWAM